MIVCAGDLMLDIFLLSALQNEEQSTGIVMRSGGSAANTAAWLAHYRSPSLFVGCVGDDVCGSMLRSDLQSEGVHLQVRSIKGRESGAVVVQVDAEGERVMRSSRGANEALGPDDLLAVQDEPTSLVHLTGYALLGPFGVELLEAAGRLARRNGVPLSFDPSSCGVVRRIGAIYLLHAIRAAGVSVLLPNAREAVELTGEESLEAALRRLGECVPRVVIKDGRNGAWWTEGAACHHVPTTPLNPVDTTGAGDAFNAGFLSALVIGSGSDRACEQGHGIAAPVLRQFGGRPPLQYELTDVASDHLVP